jgi:hypothetical protein
MRHNLQKSNGLDAFHTSTIFLIARSVSYQHVFLVIDLTSMDTMNYIIFDL